ncbi:AtpZ/AtpI family protein [Nocardioides sp. SYSU D00038]|uniref:AtpZ/AtpI family protein n=1 Tax=Nocardioides sp. SYSU D00038 TaxID=2812554 RepID=UPI001F082100|nr:AtpZ/AtpI family protein [Nocardioides sp. SYSU D00038]
MAQEHPPSERREEPQQPAGDPWMAFGYLVSGVFLYGLVGWLLDRWLDTSFLVVVGIVTGAALGTYQTWARFRP